MSGDLTGLCLYILKSEHLVIGVDINGIVGTKRIKHNTNSKGKCYFWGFTWTVNLDYLSTVSRSGWRVTAKMRVPLWSMKTRHVSIRFQD